MELVQIYECLCDRTRLRILHLLGRGPLCVCHFQEVLSKVLITSVIVFIVIPVVAGSVTRSVLLKTRGQNWFEKSFLPRFQPVTIAALLATLVLIFAFQAENLTTKWVAVILLAVPITLQVYFNSSLTYA